jgi:hypothetical protein
VACGGGPTRASSEAESRTRVRVALERGGVPHKGVCFPRVRRSFARGGVQPSSEAEFRCCGAGPLERGGVSPEGCRGWLPTGPLVLLGLWLYEVVVCHW